ncbi:flagellar hook-associated protein 1 FlgK [Palleronia aestuarii]|uniref:Flagellar hook-associated protein 1 n=1 Tax=Palleronia aestuarii TaxID=568105 RepID=A0A2W7NER2_9RHOB|nr:flagellar hook-associated protein FlgK [Palleronia aestuarii]PZX18915.1 flagellar hook-associated protein 1 FlgK [Palleronia aestuarii]
MNLSAALNNAISGLGAASRSAQVVSSNISNALTPGYGRREVDLSTERYGGVRIDGIARRADPAVIAERRGAEAEQGFSSTRSAALGRISDAVGAADDPNSLAGRVARLEAQLTQAASAPESEVRQLNVLEAARDITVHLEQATDSIQAQRAQADRGIGRAVGMLNENLARIEEINTQIARSRGKGEDVTSLLDMRQASIDQISEIVPIREITRPNGTIGLMTPGGQILLDPRPVTIEFTPANAVGPGSTLGNPLSGLTVDGRAIDMSNPDGKMAGGTLAAMFEVRDQSGVAAQARLDGFARDLVERFADPSLDTPPAAVPGLFTDRGAAFAPADETGLAGRLRLNARVDPTQGGELWRLRDGIGAAAPGDAGDARLLTAMGDIMRAPRAAASPNLGAERLSLGSLADTLVARASGDAYQAEQRETFTQTRAAALMEEEMSQGVDTDQEMQKLLLVEQAYGANARVIQAVDDMMRRLMEI